MVAYISLALAVLGIVLTVMFRRRKIVRYAYESQKVVHLHDAAMFGMDVTHKGLQVTHSVDLVAVRFVNSGNVEIRDSDFDTDLVVDCGTSAQPLEAFADPTTLVSSVSVTPHSQVVSISCRTLNPRDTFVITILLMDWNGTLSLRGRITRGTLGILSVGLAA